MKLFVKFIDFLHRPPDFTMQFNYNGFYKHINSTIYFKKKIDEKID